MRDWENHAVFSLLAPECGASAWPSAVGRVDGRGCMRLQIPATYTSFHAIVSGSGRVVLDGAEYAVSRGSVFTLLPGVHIYLEDAADDPWEYLWVDVGGPAALDVAAGCGFGYGDALYHRVADPQAIIAAMAALHARCVAEPETHPYRLMALFYAVADALRAQLVTTGPPRSAASLASRAVAMIENGVHTGINVTDVAAALGVSRVTLFRAVRQELATTPMVLLSQVRIRRAKRLLESTDHPLSVIARSAGYSNEKYFIRRFAAATGDSPSAWRRSRGRSRSRSSEM